MFKTNKCSKEKELNTLIVTGGKINKNFLKNHLKTNKYDIIITADKGTEELAHLEIEPQYIVGDFDSVDKNILAKYEKSNTKIKRLVPEKDFTDTQSALELAIDLKSTDITIVGATGTRMDHVIANIHILKEALDKGIQAKIIDENNEISLINKSIKIQKDEKYKYISLIPLTTEVMGVTIKGMKYPLNSYTMTIGNSLGVSNEQIEQIAEISIQKGILIVIKSKD